MDRHRRSDGKRSRCRANSQRAEASALDAHCQLGRHEPGRRHLPDRQLVPERRLGSGASKANARPIFRYRASTRPSPRRSPPPICLRAAPSVQHAHAQSASSRKSRTLASSTTASPRASSSACSSANCRARTSTTLHWGSQRSPPPARLARARSRDFRLTSWHFTTITSVRSRARRPVRSARLLAWRSIQVACHFTKTVC